MRRSLLTSCLLAGLIATGCSPMSATAQTPAYAIPADGTLLSVSSQAEAKRVPDVATLSAGVVTQAADANSALRQNAEQMTRVVAAIKAAGINERDVQTSGISLQPQYRYVENQAPVITGYQASNNVNLKVREIGKLGKIMDVLVAQGANQINGPSFEIDKPEPAYDEARRAALDKAKARAAMYAEALDLRVRRIVSVNEGGGGFHPPMPMMAMAKAERMQADTPVSPGENTLSVSLDVVFELSK